MLSSILHHRPKIRVFSNKLKYSFFLSFLSVLSAFTSFSKTLSISYICLWRLQSSDLFIFLIFRFHHESVELYWEKLGSLSSFFQELWRIFVCVVEVMVDMEVVEVEEDLVVMVMIRFKNQQKSGLGWTLFTLFAGKSEIKCISNDQLEI